ncbi:MAG: SMI1/KNR4 family protein [Pirellulales bacterium]
MSFTQSELLSRRYSLQLDDAWRAWFDCPQAGEHLRGAFRNRVSVEDLLADTPVDLWPGFMLPDSLPIVGNGYGDWWCIRVDENSRISEVIHWLHGGGDWIPIGKSIAEAVLWDLVSAWRGTAIAEQHASHEFPHRPLPDDIDRDEAGQCAVWISEQLGLATREIIQVIQSAASGSYQAAIQRLIDLGLCTSAARCEMIELALQAKLVALADRTLARRLGVQWIPDFTRWLFDTQHIPIAVRETIRAEQPAASFEQDWHTAERLALDELNDRKDLGWAATVAGWAAERRGDAGQSQHLYYSAKHASAFTDQSIRLRSHWFPEHFSKFSAAQLYDALSSGKGDSADSKFAQDAYLKILWEEPTTRVRSAVRDYWSALASQAESAGDHAIAYKHFHAAGWDLGAERLSDYDRILNGLSRSALASGAVARASIADAYRACLQQRLSL